MLTHNDRFNFEMMTMMQQHGRQPKDGNKKGRFRRANSLLGRMPALVVGRARTRGSARSYEARVNTRHAPQPPLWQCSLQQPLTRVQAPGTGCCRACGDRAVLVSRAFNRDDDDDGFAKYDSH